MISEDQDEASSSNANSVKISAYAGTGKTHTLVKFAEKNPKKLYLHLAFNKAVALEARRRFPRNVVCMTTHGMAYAEVGSAYNKAGKIGDVRVNDVAEYLKCSPIEALCTKKIVENFLSSESDGLNIDHLDWKLAERAGARSSIDGSWFIDAAWKLWDGMCDPTKKNILLPHDGYLKLFTLGLDDLSDKYDGIMMDEGQDSSGAILKYFMSQSCQKILAGDSHQSINSWRGAINAMERYKCDEEYWLTTSYRFGSEVSDVANRLLALKGEKRELIGAGVNAGRTGTTAIVCRTNASVLSTSIALADYGKSIYFVGGIASYRFKKIIDAYYLYSGNRSLISDTFYSSFDSFDSIENYANESYDSELKQVCKLVKKHGSNIVQMVDTATKRAASRSDEADVNLGTAHKVKGLEFGTEILKKKLICYM